MSGLSGDEKMGLPCPYGLLALCKIRTLLFESWVDRCSHRPSALTEGYRPTADARRISMAKSDMDASPQRHQSG